MPYSSRSADVPQDPVCRVEGDVTAVSRSVAMTIGLDTQGLLSVVGNKVEETWYQKGAEPCSEN